MNRQFSRQEDIKTCTTVSRYLTDEKKLTVIILLTDSVSGVSNPAPGRDLCPPKFSYSPNETHLIQLIKVFRSLETSRQVYWS